jgi:hypothetical protein
LIGVGTTLPFLCCALPDDAFTIGCVGESRVPPIIAGIRQWQEADRSIEKPEQRIVEQVAVSKVRRG